MCSFCKSTRDACIKPVAIFGQKGRGILKLIQAGALLRESSQRNRCRQDPPVARRTIGTRACPNLVRNRSWRVSQPDRPIGMGQSTLLRILAGVIEPSGGTLEWRFGAPANGIGHRVRVSGSRAAALAQHHHNVRFPLDIFGRPRERLKWGALLTLPRLLLQALSQIPKQTGPLPGAIPPRRAPRDMDWPEAQAQDRVSQILKRSGLSRLQN